MLLDAPTLALAAITATVLQAMAMAYVWYAQFRQPEVVQLAGGSSLSTLGVALAFSRPHLHPALSHVLANMLIVGGQMLITFAAARFVGRPLPPWLLVGLPAVVGFLIGFFTFVEPWLGIRIAAYSFAMAFAAGLMAWVLLSVPPGPLRATHWPLGILSVIQALLAGGRGVWVLGHEPSPDLFESTMLQTVWFSQAVIFVNLTLVGLVLMITQRPRLELNRQVTQDSLTGALNRRAFDRLAASEWSRAARHDTPLSVLVLDVDAFKSLNDTHGHDAGDLWLKAFADLCRSMLRREDLLCRSGGEEFLVLLPQTSLETAAQAAERIRRAVEDLTVSPAGADIRTTVSVGVAARGVRSLDLESTIVAADRALYRAKAAGRNRLEIDRAR